MSLQKCQLFSQSTVKEIICLLKTQYIDCHIYKFCDAEKLLFLLIIIIVIIIIIIIIIRANISYRVILFFLTFSCLQKSEMKSLLRLKRKKVRKLHICP